MSVKCRLCSADSCLLYAKLDREYYHCSTCDVVFVAEADLPSKSTERREYLLHDNRPEDARYRGFLNQLVAPVRARLADRRHVRALDFGCGPVPVLAMMLRERGIECESYDPFFAPSEFLFDHAYDLIACSEVVEHFHHPGREFERLASVLKPGGLLGVMTQRRPSDQEFERWHYRRDVTHVAFYSLKTLDWLSDRFGWTLESVSSRVHIFERPALSAIS